ncbi:YrbL family protein [Gammaproteobacteria bacterium]|nr:YrbL family protein [Gammaproteobacteria bacterium]
MINLNNIEHFAQGGNRRCFVHPLKKDRCLKVSFEGQSEKVKKKCSLV